MADFHIDSIETIVSHPGEILRCELEARNMSQKDLSEAMGKAAPVINDIIKGKRDIKVEIAVLLEAIFDNIKAEKWLEWQNQFDLQEVRKQKEIQEAQSFIADWNALKNVVNVNYLKKKLGLGKEIKENVNLIFSFLGVSSVSQLEGKITTLSSYFRKSESLQTNYINLMTWMAIVRQRSEAMQLNRRFDINRINQLVENINHILFDNKDTVARLEKTFGEFGVKFIEEKKLEKMPVDGYSFWDGDNPTIVITKRLNRIDNLAFVLFHELGHVCLHLLDEENRHHDFIEADPNSRNEQTCKMYEDEANKFANEKIWNGIDYKSLFSKVVNPYAATRFLETISRTYNINLGIVVGQYQFFCSERKLCNNAYSVCHKLIQTIN